MTRFKDFFSELLDGLLVDIAISVQLTHTDYGRAEERYRAVSTYIERPGSPLEDSVAVFYPQGSMAIGAAIASGTSDDKFDLDVVAQWEISPADSARTVLDRLFEAIRGEPGSRYYRIARRRTRCVTIDYADDMHLDVTPARRLPRTRERESWIYDHRERSRGNGDHLVANPYGFADWFKRTTGEDTAFAEAYAERYREHPRIVAEAEVEPIAEPVRILMSPRVVVLQLLKRWRNIQYDGWNERTPPSVVLAKLVAEAPSGSTGLAGMLFDAAEHIRRMVEQAQRTGALLRVANPVCPEDVLTDRWPNPRTQADFAEKLGHLVGDLRRLMSGSVDLAEHQRILQALFGERPTTNALTAYGKRTLDPIRHGRGRHQPGSGRIVAAGVGAGGVARPTRATPRHNFYGSDG